MARQSTIYLFNCWFLDVGHNHTVNFNNVTNQFNFFMNYLKFKIDNCTYLRKERTLKVPKYIDELALCNYCAFQNSVDGKMEYFFILNKTYLSENVTELTLKLDVIQTYWFEMNFTKIKSHIDRQHLWRWNQDGTVADFNMLEAEDFEIGEYILQNRTSLYDYENKGGYIVTSSDKLSIKYSGGSGSGGSSTNQSNLYKDKLVSANGFWFIKQVEGFSSIPYDLGDGTYTIGYGTTSKYDSEHYNQLAPECTEEQASNVLAESLKKNYSTYVYDTFVNYGFDMNNMKQHHFDAFVSFYYNTGSLSSKTIFTKYINGDNLESIAEVWKTTNIMAGTQFEEGLRNRRQAEVNIFLNGEYYYKDIPNLNGGTVTDNDGKGFIPDMFNKYDTPTSEIRQNIINSAMKLIGLPYVYGGNYPPLGNSSGTDCSGLCQWAYNDNGISISRTTYTQIQEGKEITLEECKAGDLVFTRGNSDNGHVVMFHSFNSDGTIHVIEAKQTGTNIMENDRTPTSDYRYRNLLGD